jgi:hypothetical protein
MKPIKLTKAESERRAKASKAFIDMIRKSDDPVPSEEMVASVLAQKAVMSEPSKTPRTDAAVNRGGNQLLNVVEESRQLETELSAAKEELSIAKKHEARCHCGELLSAHTQQEHGPVTVVENCPYTEELFEARRENDVLRIGPSEAGWWSPETVKAYEAGYQDLRARLAEAEKCLSFFASSIKCGSWWTDEHQAMLDSAMKGDK